jgi:hypothetical protein
MKAVRSRMTFANVISCLALFVALGGAAYAAGLPKNSVGTKQIKNEAVTAAKVKNGSLTGTQINASTLGTVPNATHAVSAESAAHAVSADSATQAEQANLLQGKHASDFLAANGTAQNSNQLGGLGASSYLGAPVTVRTQTISGPTTGGGTMLIDAECDRGEVAVGGGFQEAGPHEYIGGLGFGGTYQLRGDGPGVLAYSSILKELTPIPAKAGEAPTLWLLAINYASNSQNPEIIVYANCVPNRGIE